MICSLLWYLVFQLLTWFLFNPADKGKKNCDLTAKVWKFFTSSIFHDTAQCPVMPSELLPILPPSGGEKQPEQASRILLDALLEYMVTTIVRLEWHDKTSRHHRCFHFLLEMFKRYYLPKICPNYSLQTSLYNLNLGEGLLNWISVQVKKEHSRRIALVAETWSGKWICCLSGHFDQVDC